jgi:MFS family permease
MERDDYGGFAQSFAQLLIARIGVDIGGLPPSQVWVSDTYKPGERATALAVLAAGVNIGAFLSFLVGGYLGHRYGWRTAFTLASVPPPPTPRATAARSSWSAQRCGRCGATARCGRC